ncbi:DUF5753 domain-containing protein [Yinghuangia sp. YIM S10712]|uniref:DUF5753 domain-containing protein n=1 Tax=Yinghuangia sp. YIM S10712 TaxID=3436930 RepID=UPI003F539601
MCRPVRSCWRSHGSVRTVGRFVVSGLLQTPDYARAVIRGSTLERDEAEIERRTHVRITRQALLTRATAAPPLDVVRNEAVLRRPVGSAKVMAEQLNRLVELNDLDNVSIRVVPSSSGFHMGVMSGPFVLCVSRS